MKFDLFRKSGWTPPIVVGATGGSGTRLIARLLREMGVVLGERVNAAEDALAFVGIYDRYVDAVLERGTVDLAALERDLMAAIRAHLDPAGLSHWGWKNPRSIFLLPLLDAIIPGLRFVHVIRNGLDMAVSSNQNQLLLHGRSALGDASDALQIEERAVLLWKQVNARAAGYGCEMAGRYFRVRYEDVCVDPTSALSQLARGLGLALPGDGWREPIAPVAPRWPSIDRALLERLRARAGDALERFGY